MRVEVLGGLERRRRWSQDDKARIVEETLAPGATELVHHRQYATRADVSPSVPAAYVIRPSRGIRWTLCRGSTALLFFFGHNAPFYSCAFDRYRASSDTDDAARQTLCEGHAEAMG
jgi:hypothetical protein